MASLRGRSLKLVITIKYPGIYPRIISKNPWINPWIFYCDYQLSFSRENLKKIYRSLEETLNKSVGFLNFHKNTIDTARNPKTRRVYSPIFQCSLFEFTK